MANTNERKSPEAQKPQLIMLCIKHRKQKEDVLQYIDNIKKEADELYITEHLFIKILSANIWPTNERTCIVLARNTNFHDFMFFVTDNIKHQTSNI